MKFTVLQCQTAQPPRRNTKIMVETKSGFYAVGPRGTVDRAWILIEMGAGTGVIK